MLIVALSAWAAGATNSPPPAPLPTLPFNGAMETGWALADLDGDHKPDLARSRSIAHSGDNLYRVDVNLSGRSQVGSFTFSNPNAFDVKLAAIDVDGDSDLDLIVSGRFLGQRLGVFINNGEGSFSRSPANLYPESLEKTSWSPADPDSSGQAVDTKAPRHLFDGLTSTGFVAPRFVANKATAHGTLLSVFQLHPGPHRLRSPPDASLN